MKKSGPKSSRIPVYRDTGFILDSPSEMSDAFRMENENSRTPHHYIYSRYRNPTVVAAEEEVMKTEGSEWALLTQSGMAAIDVALSIFQRGGKSNRWLFSSEIYGGTIYYIESVLRARRGIDTPMIEPVDGRISAEILKAELDRVKPDLFFFETISNPLLIVADAQQLIELCKERDIPVIVDNTFATPYLCKPLEMGADIVVHSATKYLSGHGNLTAGVICGNNRELMAEAIEYRKHTGHMISADDAYRFHTQLQTFPLRFPVQCSNASGLAALLDKSPHTEAVWYPGLRGHVTHQTATKTFEGRGFGAMVTFSLTGKDENDKKKRRDIFLEAVSDTIKLVPTLGDPHTIMMPVEPVWGHKYPDHGMIRVSVGFESWNHLKGCVERGLTALH